MIQLSKRISYLFVLWISVCFPRSNLTVRDIQVGTEIDKTRIVFALSHPVALYVEPLDEGHVLVKGPEDTFWKIPEKIQSNLGALTQYKLNGVGMRRTCHLFLRPYTRFIGGFLRGNTYVLDFLTEDPPPEPEPEPLPVIEEEPLPPEPPQPTTVNIQQTLELPRNEINGLIISPKQDGTTWIIVNSDKQDFFEFQAVSESKKLYLYLPKINWPSMQTQIINSGTVTSYSVDESIPDVSTVTMDCKDEVGIIDLISTSNLDGTYDFILILANRNPTVAETKKVAEKRLEIKGLVGNNRSVSFKINSPQLVLDPDEDIGFGQSYSPDQSSKDDFIARDEEELLFD